MACFGGHAAPPELEEDMDGALCATNMAFLWNFQGCFRSTGCENLGIMLRDREEYSLTIS
jgi:hypothetical protein